MLIDDNFEVIDSKTTGLDNRYMALVLANDDHYNVVVIDKENDSMMSMIVDGKVDDDKTKESATRLVELINEYYEDNGKQISWF